MISFFNTTVQDPLKVLSIYESALKDAQEKIKALGLHEESPFSSNSDVKPHFDFSENWKSYIWALVKTTLINGQNSQNTHQFPLKDLFDIRVGVLDISQDPILINLGIKDKNESPTYERALCIRPSSFDENNHLRSIDLLLKEENILLSGRKEKPKKTQDKFTPLPLTDERIVRREDYIMLNKRETKGFSMLKSFQNEYKDGELNYFFGKPLVITHHFIRLRPKKIALSIASIDFLHILLDIIIEGHVSSTNLVEENDSSKVKSDTSSLNKTLQDSIIQIPSDEAGRNHINQICSLYRAFEEIEENTREVKKHFIASLYKQILQNDIIT
jgi:hypothetical protein